MIGLGIFCGRTNRLSSYTELRILKNVTYVVLQVLILFKNSLCILITLLYAVVLLIISILVTLFEENIDQGPKRFSITCTRYCNLHQLVIPALQEREDV